MSIPLSFKIPGWTEAIKQIQGLPVNSLQATAIALRRWAEETRTKNILPVTPKRFGTLRGDVYVKPPVIANDKVSVEFGVGGPAAGYAAVVHEQMSGKIKWTTPGTGPKFIENPLRERMDDLPDEVAKENQKELEKI